MTLTKPFINTLPAFDANIGITFNINVLGDKIIAYQFFIFNNDNTGIPIFTSNKYDIFNDIESQTIRTFPITIKNGISGLENSILRISNNKEYLIQAKIYDNLNSETSNYVLFNCYTSPSITFEYAGIIDGVSTFVDLGDGTTINLSQPNVKIIFNSNDIQSVAQPNIAKLDLIGVLDDGNLEEIYTTSEIYNFSKNTQNNTYELETELKGFSINVDSNGNLLQKDKRQYNYYIINYKVVTLDNFEINGSIKNLNCFYNTLSNSPYIDIYNLCDKGVIQINCELTSFSGISNPTPIVFTENGNEVDLTQKDSWVKWQKYFTLEQPYTLRIWGRNFNKGTIVNMTSSSNNQKYIKITYNEKGNYAFVSLKCAQPNSNGKDMHPYYIESNTIALANITSETKLFIGVQQQGGLFDIDFRILE